MDGLRYKCASANHPERCEGGFQFDYLDRTETELDCGISMGNREYSFGVKMLSCEDLEARRPSTWDDAVHTLTPTHLDFAHIAAFLAVVICLMVIVCCAARKCGGGGDGSKKSYDLMELPPVSTGETKDVVDQRMTVNSFYTSTKETA